MRLNKLYVTNFGGIESAEVEFGPGLNVLHGPNDLGKSTLVEAIRLGLLLPHGSTHGERFVAWGGGPEPEVPYGPPPALQAQSPGGAES